MKIVSVVIFINMINRKLNENDINILVKKVINESSTFAGIKGFFSGYGYNYSKYKYEINEVVIGIRKKLITEDQDKQIRSFIRRISIADNIISRLNPEDVCRIWSNTENDALYYADEVILGIVWDINQTLGIENSYHNKDMYKFFEDYGYYDKLKEFFHKSFESFE